MKRVLLTGMSGVGKSTVIEELAARGYKAVDADYGGLSELVSVPEDEPTRLDPGQDWVWREDRIQHLPSAEDAGVLFLGGTSPNQGKFYPLFDCSELRPEGVLRSRGTKDARALRTPTKVSRSARRQCPEAGEKYAKLGIRPFGAGATLFPANAP